jgi:hypothetical protein
MFKHMYVCFFRKKLGFSYLIYNLCVKTQGLVLKYVEKLL